MWYFDNLVTKRHSVFVRVCEECYIIVRRQFLLGLRKIQALQYFFCIFSEVTLKTARICDKYYKIMQNKIKIKLR